MTVLKQYICYLLCFKRAGCATTGHETCLAVRSLSYPLSEESAAEQDSKVETPQPPADNRHNDMTSPSMRIQDPSQHDIEMGAVEGHAAHNTTAEQGSSDVHQAQAGSQPNGPLLPVSTSAWPAAVVMPSDQA